MKRYIPLCAALLAFPACDGSDPSSADSAVLDRAGLIEALRAHGALVVTAGPVAQPFFSVSGQILTVNSGDVQTFEYESAADAQLDAARVSPDGSTIGTTTVAWIATPHFFLAGRVIALYVGDERAVLLALEDVMGPQIAGG